MKNAKTKVFIIILGVVCALCVAASVASYVSQSNILSELYSQQTELQRQKDDLIKGNASAIDIEVKQDTAFDATRKVKDDAVVQTAAGKVFTWNSLDTYNTARENAKKVFHLADGDPFFKGVYPVVEPVLKHGDGSSDEKTNYIEERGLNMTFNNVSTYCVGVDGDKYSYFAVVTIDSTDSMGQLANTKALLSYQMDGGNNISGLKCSMVRPAGEN